jgi:hypothetical protein
VELSKNHLVNLHRNVMFRGGISTILFFLFSMITSTLMMVHEASNLRNGFGAHSRHSKSSQGSLATPL